MALSKYRVFVVLLTPVMVVVSAVVLWILTSPDPFQTQVDLLLSEVKIAPASTTCHGGWLGVDGKRQMYCHLTFAESVNALELRRLGMIVTVTDKGVCDASIRRLYSEKEFLYQSWIPSRHGFFGAFAVVNERTNEACLHLAIAYG